MKKTKRFLRRYYRGFGLLFAVLLFGLAAVSALSPDQDYSAAEKRSLAGFPKFTFSSVADGSFMEGVEDWAADQFPFRAQLMRIKTEIASAFGMIRSQNIYRCPDGSLAEAFVRPSDSAFRQQTEAIADFCGRCPDARVYFCIAPTAVSVLADRLPETALTDDQNLYLDQLSEILGRSGAFIDLREVFAANREQTQLYYRTDHHWTTDAAFLAWQEIYRVMGLTSQLRYTPGVVCNTFIGSLVSASGFTADRFDSVTVYVPEEPPLYTVTYDQEQRMTASVYVPDALNGDDPYQVFFGGNYPKLTIRTAADTERKLLLFKDSYANCLIPFLIPDFSRITVIDARYYYDDLDMEVLSGGYTDILFLYNANTLAADTGLVSVLRNEQVAGTPPEAPSFSPDFSVPSETLPQESGSRPVQPPDPPESSSPSTEESFPPSAASPSETGPLSELTVDDLVFIGDSRTLSMASGGRWAYRLLPDSAVFASWGGELTDESAVGNARAAAAAGRSAGIFWYGINDVQGNPDRDNAEKFRANYEAVIRAYREGNPESDIVILSILTTSVNEKDYYDGQEENIRKYNAELASLCAEEGYTFLDLTELYTGDDCFAAGDYIHFSQEWYETAFLPAVFGALGVKNG